MSNLQLFNGTEVTSLATGMTSAIKSIQRGITMEEWSHNITISEVNMSKSVVICVGDGNAAWGSRANGKDEGERLSVYAELVGPTTLYVCNQSGMAGSEPIVGDDGELTIPHQLEPAHISWQVIEFY